MAGRNVALASCPQMSVTHTAIMPTIIPTIPASEGWHLLSRHNPNIGIINLMPTSAFDRFSGAIGCSWSVEIGQYVFCSSVEGSSQCFEFGECRWNACADGINNCLHELLAVGSLWFAVGGNHALIDSPSWLQPRRAYR